MITFRFTTILLFWFYFYSSHSAATGFVYQYEEDPEESSLIQNLTSFEQETLQSDDQYKPMLIAFTTPWCMYCETLEQEILEPLIRSNKYTDEIIIRKLEVNAYSDIIGFDGKAYAAEDIGMKYNIKLYPTVVFFDAEGREIGERIVGITVLEYIAERIDRAIETAIDTAESTPRTN